MAAANTENNHLTENDIAGMLEGDWDSTESKRALEHLKTCESCLLMFQNAAMHYGVELSDFPAIEDKELIEIGERIALERSSQGGRDSDDASSAKKPFPGIRSHIAKAALAATFICILILLLLYVSGNGPGRLDPTLIAQVQQAAETATKRGMIVIPGGEQSLALPVSIYRSGFAPMSDSLNAAISMLYDTYSKDEKSREAAFWLLAGYVASGQIKAARELSPDVRERYPDDARIGNLAAIIKYMQGSYEEAEKILAGLLENDPDDAVARINLAVVLLENEKPLEAREILEDAQQRYAGTPYAKRAREIISSLSDR